MLYLKTPIVRELTYRRNKLMHERAQITTRSPRSGGGAGRNYYNRFTAVSIIHSFAVIYQKSPVFMDFASGQATSI